MNFIGVESPLVLAASASAHELQVDIHNNMNAFDNSTQFILQFMLSGKSNYTMIKSMLFLNK